MIKKIRRIFYNFRKNFVSKNLTKNFRMIFFGRLAIKSVTHLMGLFLPIFLYSFFKLSLPLVILYYLSIEVIYALLLIPGCKNIMNRFGIKKSLQISTFFGIAYYFAFFLINHYSANREILSELNQWWWIMPTVILGIIFRLTHWIPFHTNLAKLTEKNVRASQISLIEATTMALGAIIPLISGIILSYFGYDILFLLAAAIYLVSLIPYSLLPEVKEKFTWSWKETWQKFSSKKMRPIIVAYAGDGAESVAGSIIWPIFIWELLSGNYFQIGALSSLIIVVTITLQLTFGAILNRPGRKQKYLRYGAAFYSLGWIFKALINSAFHVFLFSTYHNFSKIFSHTSFDSLNYDIAADQGHYVDEYTVLRELAVLLGKTIMSILVLILFPYFSLQHLFVLAALSSLSIAFLKKELV